MAHPNAELAANLVVWRDTHVDRHDSLPDAQRKGFVTKIGDGLVLTRKGEDFIAKWTQGRPADTYVRKPNEGTEQHASKTPYRFSYARH